MIPRVELQERATAVGLAEAVVEKDYVIGWVLWGIANSPEVSDHWIFKGGTSLKKCYIDTYRFSEDLDFTVVPPVRMDAEELGSAVRTILERVQEESGIDFSTQPPRMDVFRDGWSAEGRAYYVGPRKAPAARIKIDLRSDEIVVAAPVMRPIDHQYSDTLPSPAEVRCYGFHELFAEKIRAMGERCRPRDLYDVVNLYWRPEFREHGPLVNSVLEEKCRGKGIEMVTIDTVLTSSHQEQVNAAWSTMLSHQLPALPAFEHFWGAVPEIFAWLDGRNVEELTRLGVEGDIDILWSPPPTFWSSGDGIALEPVRFGAVNRVCVELGYQGTRRIIEPYSLRRTTAGAILLHAIKVDTREHRTYRVDRIQGVRVLNQPFRPVYTIEFTQAGEFSTPPIVRTPRSAVLESVTPVRRAAPRRPRVRTSQYVVQCLGCGKRFYRGKPGTRIGKHRAKDAYYTCGSRSGYYV